MNHRRELLQQELAQTQGLPPLNLEAMERMDASRSPVPSPRASYITDPETGFIETPGNFPDAFDVTKKKICLEKLRSSGFDVKGTCVEMGISPHTFYKHYRMDNAFEKAIRQATEEYSASLEWLSMAEAMKPKNTFERLVQLRRLLPTKYAPERNNAFQGSVTINVSGDFVTGAKTRTDYLETTASSTDYFPTTAQPAEQLPTSPTESNSSTELNPGERT